MLVFLLFLLPITVFGDVPQTCTSLNVKYGVDEPAFNFSLKFDILLDAYLQGPDTYVKLTVDMTSIDIYHKIDQICTSVHGNLTCYDNYFQGIDFWVGNSTFYIIADIVNADNGNSSTLYSFYGGLGDEGGFSLIDGRMFSSELHCVDKLFAYDSYGIGNGTQCCTSMKLAVQAPDASKTCSVLTSRATIYNTNDSYSIFATIFNTITFGENNTVNVEGSYQADNLTVVEIDYNDIELCQASAKGKRNCTIYLPPTNDDIKLLLQATTHRRNNADFYIPVGRLLIRNGKPLLEEGVGFSDVNNCLYLSEFPNDYQVVSSQFCCTSFV